MCTCAKYEGQSDPSWQIELSEDACAQECKDDSHLVSTSTPRAYATELACHCAAGSRKNDPLPCIGRRKEARGIL